MSGGFGRTPPETIGDSRTEFNRIVCTSKSEAAVTFKPSFLIAGDDDEMFMTRNLKVTIINTTEQHLNARSDKSVA